MPPLIVHFYDHKGELNDGNHRHEAYKRLGIAEYPVIVWITEKEEYEEFLCQYGIFLNKSSYLLPTGITDGSFLNTISFFVIF